MGEQFQINFDFHCQLSAISEQLGSNQIGFTWQVSQTRVEGKGKWTLADGMDATNRMISFSVSSSLVPARNQQRKWKKNRDGDVMEVDGITGQLRWGLQRN